MPDTTNPNALAGKPLMIGKVEGSAIGAGADYTFPGPESLSIVRCEGADTLVIEADMTGGATGDLAVHVQPVEADGVTVMPVDLPPAQSVGPTLSGGHVYYFAEFDVSAQDAVKIWIHNANAAGQTITRASWKLA